MAHLLVARTLVVVLVVVVVYLGRYFVSAESLLEMQLWRWLALENVAIREVRFRVQLGAILPFLGAL